MLFPLPQIVAAILAAHAWGFAQGALVGRATCAPPPPARAKQVPPEVRPFARVPFQPEHGNKRY